MAAKARAMKARTVTVLEPVEQTTTEAEPADETKGIPLFEGLEGEVLIHVYRLEPIEEGTIGTLPADADEGTIQRRWGGGVYRVSAKGTDGQFKRRQRTITVGGDPKFESKDALRRYRIKMGDIPDDAKAAPAPAPAPAGPVLGGSEILAILQTSHAQSLQFMQAQLQAQAAAADQRATAAQKLADDARARDQQFFASMIGMMKAEAKATPGPDPMAMITLLLKGLDLGRDMAGGKDGDPVSAFIANLPQIIPQAKELLQSGRPGGAPPALPAPEADQGEPNDKRIVLTGEIAKVLESTVLKLQAKGYDAEKALAVALQQLGNVPNAPAKAAAAPSPAAAAAPAAAPAGNGTPEPARATRKK